MPSKTDRSFAPPRGSAARAVPWPPSRSAEAVGALADAFHDYPVMRYIIGDAGGDYDRRLHLLIGHFVAGRVLRGNPILAIEEGGSVVAVATMTPSGAQVEPPELGAIRAALWQELGAGARARSEALIAIWERLAVPRPQYHLNMLGVRRSHAGLGLGRVLLDAVHEMSRRDATSEGVSLSTEDPKNVLLYQHCGYAITSHERVADDLETWIMFREDAPPRSNAPEGSN
jgi:GNAT superfamily N-acetyltransferase